MELEELKAAWSSLDERMKEQKGLNAVIIKEMLVAKSDSGLSKLINYTYFGIIIILMAVAFMIWRIYNIPFGLFKICFFTVILFCISGVIIGIYNLKQLYRIDFTKSIGNNIRLVQQYSLAAKKQLISSYILAGILMIFAVITCLASFNNVALWRWAAIIAAICIGIVGCWWEYKRMYRKNVDSILKSLEELKELEE